MRTNILNFKMIVLLFFFSTLQASNEITIDSLFQKEKGLRSITSVSFLSSGSPRTFNLYPQINSYDDGTIITQTKTLALNQTLLYAYTSKLDFISNFSLETQKIDFLEESIKSKSDTEFSNFWIGAKYDFDKKIYDFKQSLTLQIALLENSHYQNHKEKSYLKSFNLRYANTAYLDPVVVTIYLETIQNFKKDIGIHTVEYPNIYTFGIDTNIILNPKISLSLNFQESYQSDMKEDSKKVNPSTILSQIGFGVNYNINSKNALIISTSTGTSSVAPDSRLSFSLWHKF